MTAFERIGRIFSILFSTAVALVMGLAAGKTISDYSAAAPSAPAALADTFPSVPPPSASAAASANERRATISEPDFKRMTEEFERAAPLGAQHAVPLPTLTPEQRQEALAKAAEARRKRAEVKAELKSGKRTLGDILAKTDNTVGKMKVSNVLESLPGVGKVRARKLMEKLDISASRRVRGLGAKQKDALLAEFSKK